MCDTCECSDPKQGFTISSPKENGNQIKVEEKEGHSHGHGHGHGNEHSHGHAETIELGTTVLNQNKLVAERNRGYFQAKNIRAFNLVSSPGSGKTTLLEVLIKASDTKNGIYVIEGDQQTLNDAQRIENAGAAAIQINTGNGCHLDAEMVNQAVKSLAPAENSLLFIENVGNLVCPALFDLGERSRIVIVSVTEGDDKPLKYPNMFETSQLCIISKTDLLPYVSFNVQQFKENALRINHHLDFLEVSATKKLGLAEVLKWISV
ncbi:MAG: hydrogenase nickel incorporation protein HypB [Bacteroidales bacterium]|nr:hydrogenase nickel incorporation protein HypB [Bacteroidales bacterium]MBN2818978.1 hydrogenase nickel incorporation protein HypB [Bacteroidales bacterium]